MKENLKSALRVADDVDFKELQSALSIANLVKDTMKTFEKSFEYMEEKLGLSRQDFYEVWCGSYPYDLRMISKIECLIDDLKVEDAEKDKTELIKFGKYKYSRPNNEQKAEVCDATDDDQRTKDDNQNSIQNTTT